MYNLFTYGSLMCEDIMFSVAGDCRKQGNASLVNYRRLQIKNETYPGLIKASGYTVDGVVYSSITELGLTRLDRFEGEMYQRVLLDVELSDGTVMAAFCYVIKADFEFLITGCDWDFKRFLQQGRQEFLAKYMGFGEIDGVD